MRRILQRRGRSRSTFSGSASRRESQLSARIVRSRHTELRFVSDRAPNDAALNSRCIVIPLRETERTDLKRTTHPEILEAADHLQKQLLQYRFEKLNSLALPQIQASERLHSRTRDLYEALALANGDPGICEDLVRAFKILQEMHREPLSPSQTAVLRTLFR